MTSTLDIDPPVRKLAATLAARMEVIQGTQPIILGSDERAVIFVYASWSAPAVLGFKHLCAVLSALPPVLLVVVDADGQGAQDLWRLSGGAAFAGAGETFWVREGKIVAELRNTCTNPTRELELNTRKLIGASEDLNSVE